MRKGEAVDVAWSIQSSHRSNNDPLSPPASPVQCGGGLPSWSRLLEYCFVFSCRELNFARPTHGLLTVFSRSSERREHPGRNWWQSISAQIDEVPYCRRHECYLGRFQCWSGCRVSSFGDPGFHVAGLLCYDASFGATAMSCGLVPDSRKREA